MKDIEHNEVMLKMFKEDNDYLLFFIKQLVNDKAFDDVFILCKQFNIDLTELLFKECCRKLEQL